MLRNLISFLTLPVSTDHSRKKQNVYKVKNRTGHRESLKTGQVFFCTFTGITFEILNVT